MAANKPRIKVKANRPSSRGETLCCEALSCEPAANVFHTQPMYVVKLRPSGAVHFCSTRSDVAGVLARESYDSAFVDKKDVPYVVLY